MHLAARQFGPYRLQVRARKAAIQLSTPFLPISAIVLLIKTGRFVSGARSDICGRMT